MSECPTCGAVMQSWTRHDYGRELTCPNDHTWTEPYSLVYTPSEGVAEYLAMMEDVLGEECLEATLETVLRAHIHGMGAMSEREGGEGRPSFEGQPVFKGDFKEARDDE